MTTSLIKINSLLEDELDFDSTGEENKFDELEMIFMEIAFEEGMDDPTDIFPLIAKFQNTKTYSLFVRMSEEDKNSVIRKFIKENR